MVVGEFTQETQVLVIGAGPGGYTAALRAADLGLQVTLVDTRPTPGGVCLHVGCIPSKALLHAAELIHRAADASDAGLTFERPRIDLERMRAWKSGIVEKLTRGILTLCKKRSVEYISAKASFEDPHTVRLEGGEVARIRFRHGIIATGSRPSMLPGIDTSDPRILDSTRALEIETVPRKLLVIGGGYIGLELGTVYAALGSRVTCVEMLDSLLPGMDADVVRVLANRLKKYFAAIHTSTRVAEIRPQKGGIRVAFEGPSAPSPATFDAVLVAVGRTPNTEGLALERAGLSVDEQGFIPVDAHRRTAVPHILAIGDVAGQPMLAHKAMYEGRVAAAVIAGHDEEFAPRAIPAVVFTDPEVAWTGMTETEARQAGIEYVVRKFPWGASGRAATMGRPDGLTKMICDPAGRILGVVMVGAHCGELIAEATLAIEMAAVAEDLAHTIHPHPTLSETVGEVAEAFGIGAIHTTV